MLRKFMHPSSTKTNDGCLLFVARFAFAGEPLTKPKQFQLWLMHQQVAVDHAPLLPVAKLQGLRRTAI
jgi:hypothetical protein